MREKFCCYCLHTVLLLEFYCFCSIATVPLVTHPFGGAVVLAAVVRGAPFLGYSGCSQSPDGGDGGDGGDGADGADGAYGR